MFASAQEAYGSVDVAFNNAGISPPDDDSILDTGIEAWRAGAAGEPHVGVPVLQGGHPLHAAPGPGRHHQHGLVRRHAGRCHVADLLHREQGRRARDDPRARRAVRAGGHPGQRAVARAGEHPAAARAVREGPRAGGPPARAHPDGPLRRGRARSPPRSRSSPATTRRSSPRPTSSSTAASPGPTSPRSDAPRRRCRPPRRDRGTGGGRGNRPPSSRGATGPRGRTRRRGPRRPRSCRRRPTR